MKLIFMGTPDFAVPSLQALAHQFNVIAVVTAPDRPAGRGKKMQKSAVKLAAEELHIPVLQPTNLKSEEFHIAIRDLGADLFVVVAFRMLPEAVWSLPPKGTINLHASLLPQFRGAAPINRAIMAGKTTTGLTTFFIEKEIDTGKVIDQLEVAIAPDQTAGELHDVMCDRGVELLITTVIKISKGKTEGYAQNSEGELLAAPKIFREDCRIDWSQPSEMVHNHIRGLSPYPGAYTLLEEDDNGQNPYKILRAERTDRIATGSPGACFRENGHMFVSCADLLIEIAEIQAPGKRAMAAEAFLRGFDPPNGIRFKSPV